MTIVQQVAPKIPDVTEAWDLYSTLFADINVMAAQRHLMTADEFAAVYYDQRVLKFYVHDKNNALAGMSVLTQNLGAWPLISPPYFARRWPEHFARRAIWYVGFVGVAGRHVHGFRELIRNMYAHVIPDSGIAVMDFCTYNVTQRRLPDVTLKLLSWMNPAADMELADAQTFVVYRFDRSGEVT
ncbi:hypothetical protein HH310_41890 [Actinoplanes sp. TBRC 11911]|uniref:hypothetical protein n=1 Tax=Actinoplanes sp. TBRC 11911 TaxID=2729386 RepID=UPI00145F3E07|nr:hypothetical protein [Actinoplanes sp. TBRC 11911]NMO57702.1 hypothetical protein [Actinoplanes sp. TBRC 11911]